MPTLGCGAGFIDRHCGCGAPTLGNGAYSGGNLVGGMVWLVKMVVSCCSADLFSSAMGAISDW